MCDYCEKEEILLDRDFVDSGMFGWYSEPIDPKSITESNYIVFVDRGYLRLADGDDCQCMDHGEKIKINFCPMCGVELCN